jgi:hypothetical protein
MSHLQQVISAYAESIKNTINEGDWDSLNKILKDRQLALEKFFAGIDSKEQAVQMKAVFKKMQEEDVVFLSKVQAKKKEMKKQYTSLKQGRKSVKAYQQL